ncbi:unnamed protein product [Acidocella sp. C78]|uniref:hypothetical protein n=1 Tax=Acidocella sp. C78 TaxID=1671486 RepID=UPI00191B905C|nr:hypothetical protein [Acidocella sp. C78]CAG4927731.1 unnamed protein product [Acidocella sp. C78]
MSNRFPEPLRLKGARADAAMDAELRRNVAFWMLRGVECRSGAAPSGLGIEFAAGRVVFDDGIDRLARRFALRLAGEWLALVRAGVKVPLAGLAAARAAAQFAEAERMPPLPRFPWVATMAAELPPGAGQLERISRDLAALAGETGPAAAAEIARCRALWPVIGIVESIMETGGDIRLMRDPQSDLNGYGCSHRPRPWAVTFASSTASSVSERGYEAADRVRLRLTAAMLRDGDRRAIGLEAVAVRRRIGHDAGLPAGGAVVLAASGTDSELLALALSHLPDAGRPITTILLAPEETGSGVPMAAVGRHFAIDTANGHDVSRAAPIGGFRPDTELVSVPLRDKYGIPRTSAAIEDEIGRAVAAAAAAGRRVILHALDLSKTGLLAPSMALLRTLRERFGEGLDIVVDACQMRIGPARIRAYLDLDAVVQITGSKFLTGPPFAGAALIPPRIARRLGRGRLPSGLDAYFSRGEWPPSAAAARGLPDGANYGLLLRWRAALAELKAFAAVPEARKSEVLLRFRAAVEAAVAQHDIFVLQTVADPAREGGGWDSLRSVFAFAVRAPGSMERLLDPTAARRLYHWLNADCAALFDTARERSIAARICHIGQPVALPDGEGGQIGWLRVSAGARLVSGEPSHRGLATDRRLAREMGDLALVFDKIALLRAHWDRLAQFDPRPRYR